MYACIFQKYVVDFELKYDSYDSGANPFAYIYFYTALNDFEHILKLVIGYLFTNFQ